VSSILSPKDAAGTHAAADDGDGRSPGRGPGEGLWNNPAVPLELELFLRLLLAAALAGLVGLERELHEQPAGFRTHILVGLGAALFTVISAFGFNAVIGEGPPTQIRADVTRVASQIVVGIGFLGGGAIIKYGASVRGLTTAASLWVTAAIGTAAGIGLLALAAETTAVALLALTVLRPIRALIRRVGTAEDEFVIEADTALALDEVVQSVREAGAAVRNMRVEHDRGLLTVVLLVRLPPRFRPEGLVERLRGHEHVHNVDWAQ
jgi:putative Mg2+ transporter-C (MgtC) family protein